MCTPEYNGMKIRNQTGWGGIMLRKAMLGGSTSIIKNTTWTDVNNKPENSLKTVKYCNATFLEYWNSSSLNPQGWKSLATLWLQIYANKRIKLSEQPLIIKDGIPSKAATAATTKTTTTTTIRSLPFHLLSKEVKIKYR